MWPARPSSALHYHMVLFKVLNFKVLNRPGDQKPLALMTSPGIKKKINSFVCISETTCVTGTKIYTYKTVTKNTLIPSFVIKLNELVKKIAAR